MLESHFLRDTVAARLIVMAGNGVALPRLQREFRAIPDLPVRLDSLERRGLLVQRGDTVRTTFPILTGEVENAYRRFANNTAADIVDSVALLTADVLAHVRHRGWTDWGYHFIWSQVFDSQFAWEQMLAKDLVPPLTPPVAWVVYPDHPFKTGTNYFGDPSSRPFFLVVTWAPRADGHLAWFEEHAPAVVAIGMSKRRAVSEATELASHGLLDERGRLTLPVIARGDTLYGMLYAASEGYIRLLQRRLRVDSLADALRIDRRLAWAMAYHDVSWEVLGLLVNRGAIAKPAALLADSPTRQAALATVIAVYPPFLKRITGQEPAPTGELHRSR